MGDQRYQNVPNFQPVHSISPNGSNSSITSRKRRKKVIKQTFGPCGRCRKKAIKTMHIRCRHIGCCFTCSKTCKECPKCRLPSNKHLAIYATCYEPSDTNLTSNNNETETPPSETDELNDRHMSEHTEEVERVVDSPNESDCDLICDESNNKNKFSGEKMDERDELYDPNADHTPAICGVCLSRNATCFILSVSETIGVDRCGHDICNICVNQIVACPYCRRPVISYLEKRDCN